MVVIVAISRVQYTQSLPRCGDPLAGSCAFLAWSWYQQWVWHPLCVQTVADTWQIKKLYYSVSVLTILFLTGEFSVTSALMTCQQKEVGSREVRHGSSVHQLQVRLPFCLGRFLCYITHIHDLFSCSLDGAC